MLKVQVISIYKKEMPASQLKFKPLLLAAMQIEDLSNLAVEQLAIASKILGRYVIIDCYLPKNVVSPASLSLLLLNDGQDLPEMGFAAMMNEMLKENEIRPLLCVGIHTGKDRENEYGTAKAPDYENRGARARAYSEFILDEL